MLYILAGPALHRQPGFQLVLGKKQVVGKPFALVESGIRDQYTRAEGRFPSRCQF